VSNRPTPPFVPFLLATALALAACGPTAPEEQATGETTDEATETPAPEEDAPEGEAPTGEVTLTLLTHDSFDVSEQVLQSFVDQTGIDVAVVPLGDAGSALNQTILTRDAPQGDLLFGVDNTFLSRALEAELFLPHESPALGSVPDEFQLDPEHRVTPVDYGDVCLNYDLAWFEQEDLAVPDDLDDLTAPEYAGLLAVQNPATSSPGLAFLLATIERFGEDGYLDYWEALRDNDVVVTDGWSEAYYDEFSGAGDGDRPLVVSYASSPPAEVYFADPAPASPPTGVIEASCFRQIEFVGILAGTPHEAEARQLVDFLLGLEFQQDLPLTMFVFPVNEEAQLPEVFEQHAVVPDEPFRLDPVAIGANREEWIRAWTSTVLR
jgi:thiamine transport system substrate-binding protein